MKRFLLSACLSSLVLAVGAPALAQQALVEPALAAPLPPIPAPTQAAYPGVIRYEVDATDLDRRIVRVRETIPVAQAGPMVLLYPQWLPGNHSTTGPISALAGVTVTAGGRPLRWTRDTVHVQAFHFDVPEGVDEVVVEFQWLTALSGDEGRVVVTQEMMNLQWEKALLYPAGYLASGIQFEPTVRLPEGWTAAVALDGGRPGRNGSTTYDPVDLVNLIDSPMFAGRHFAQVDLDPGGRSPVRLNIVSDDPANLVISEDRLQAHRDLVTQADRLFGARHFDHYDFLLAVTDRLGGVGLEHHRSSENSVVNGYFTSWAETYQDRDLLGHEYVHSWNGKYRRPADQITPNYNTPVQNSMLWVYEGQTQYWGAVLTARSGLMTTDDALGYIAAIAAFYQAQAGREWRALQDTTNGPIIQYRGATSWPSWQRTSSDYYREALLVWLDADTLIRERSGGQRSLDDFARAFFGQNDGDYAVDDYTFAELTGALNGIETNDWAAFLRDRLDAVGDDAAAPLAGIERGGYRLVFRPEPTHYQKTLNTELDRVDLTYSLGFSTNKANRITSVQWDGPAFDLGLTPGWDILSVNGETASTKALTDAVTAAAGTRERIELIVRNGARVRTVVFEYHDGLRYPHLERIEGTPDHLGDILAAREN